MTVEIAAAETAGNLSFLTGFKRNGPPLTGRAVFLVAAFHGWD